MRFQIRSDRNFTNSAIGYEWFRTGIVYAGIYPQMKTGTVRVFPAAGQGQPIDVAIGLLERID